MENPNQGPVQPAKSWWRRSRDDDNPVGGVPTGTSPNVDDRDLQAASNAVTGQPKSPLNFSGLFLVVFLFGFAGVLGTWGGSRVFDQFGPSLTEEGVVTDTDHTTYRCTRERGGVRVTETCHKYSVEGRTEAGDDFEVRDKNAYEDASRGDEVVVERSRITGRVLDLQGSDWRFDARRSVTQQLLGILLFALGLGAIALGVVTIRGVQRVPAVSAMAVVVFFVAAVPTTRFVWDPIDVSSAQPIDDEQAASVVSEGPSEEEEEEPAEESTRSTAAAPAARPSTTSPSTTAEAATSLPASTSVPSTTQPSGPAVGGSAKELLAVFEEPEAGVEFETATIEMPAVDIGTGTESTPISVSLLVPVGWEREDSLIGDTLYVEFADSEGSRESIGVELWFRSWGDDFAEFASIFLNRVNAEDVVEVEILGRQAFLGVQFFDSGTVRHLATVDGTTHAVLVQTFHSDRPDDQWLDDLVFAVAGSVEVLESAS